MSEIDTARHAVLALLDELVRGAAGDTAYVLNPGDPGLLASLEGLSADEANRSSDGRQPLAHHVDHLCYGLSLLNRWAAGDENVFANASYAASWTRPPVDQEQWTALRARLADEAASWRSAIASRREWDPVSFTGTLASVVHLAYHFGAIRQIAPAVAGPKAKD